LKNSQNRSWSGKLFPFDVINFNLFCLFERSPGRPVGKAVLTDWPDKRTGSEANLDIDKDCVVRQSTDSQW